MFAKVANRFLAQNTSWRVAFYGFGLEQSIIEQLLKNPIRTGQAIVAYTSNLQEVLVKSKIFVSLISPDSYPSQSVCEAMASSNALLLANQGQTRKIFYDNNGGVLI